MTGNEEQKKYQLEVNHTQDFTVSQYVALLRLAKEKYSFANYSGLDREGIVIWRHDCDYSLNRAVRFAQVEYT